MKKHGVKLGFMSAFARASAVALQEIPQVCCAAVLRRPLSRRTMAEAHGTRARAPMCWISARGAGQRKH